MEVVLTRSALERQGEAMTATVLADEFIAVEVDTMQEPTLGHVQVHTGMRKRVMCWLEGGNLVIRTEAYHGLGPIITPTRREFFCYHGDVCAVRLDDLVCCLDRPDKSVRPIETTNL